MAADKTYEPIATNTLGSSSASVIFSSIPQTYTDLVLTMDAIPYTGSEGALIMNFNSDTASNYSYTSMSGDGSSASASRGSNISRIVLGMGNTLNNPRRPLIINHIMSYSHTAKFKTVLTRTSEPTTETTLIVNQWRSTSAITSITIGVSYIYNIGAGSTFTLYGIKSA